ncbi:unnamed protein product (macronuclear) [Paramecium tetraurelia]|uniref:Uncharacterized protein n=1 Tax=Paramecium tetraurelia TaxID=5888 RepID=A0E2Z6_PARTE|nr:uncharacterized protein GSPATT00022835001 [Paramecium tetraurelia]CAK89663.1 unnamed protein product [Paramecium tetraurelia]|eukprot:XP_001457060.1 hypothetical protein (macronuclear) [Paramecium tetraurelia strain d4-2]
MQLLFIWILALFFQVNPIYDVVRIKELTCWLALKAQRQLQINYIKLEMYSYSYPRSDQQCFDLANTEKCCLDSLNHLLVSQFQMHIPNSLRMFVKFSSSFIKTIDAAVGGSLIPETQSLSPYICDYYNQNIYWSLSYL